MRTNGTETEVTGDIIDLEHERDDQDVQCNMDRVLSIEATAERLAISPWTVRKWIQQGRIASCKLGARRVVPLFEVQRIIADSLEHR